MLGSGARSFTIRGWMVKGSVTVQVYYSAANPSRFN
jgi:hypothetical protein